MKLCAVLLKMGAILLLATACSSMPSLPFSGTPIPTANYHRLATQMAQNLAATNEAAGPAATQTAEAQSARLAIARQWPVLLVDPFDDNQHEWPTGEETGDLTGITWQVQGGKYRWEAVTLSPFVYWTRPTLSTTTDFYLSAWVLQEAGPADGEIGLVFRLEETETGYDYYFFRIDGQQQYALDVQINGEWSALIPYTYSPLINEKESNQLGVLATGSHFVFYINQTEAAQYQDQRLADGYTGTAISMYKVGDEGVFLFDAFELHVPENPVSSPGD